MSDAPLTLTVEQAARLLGVGRGTAYDAVRAGEIPSVRIGRRVLVPRHALLALVGATGDDQNEHDPGRHPRVAQKAGASGPHDGT